MPDERLLKFVPDYRLNLIAPEQIAEESFDKFHTDLGAVMQYIKHKDDDSMEQLMKNKRFAAVERDAAELINDLTGSKLELYEAERTVNMGRAWENSLKMAIDKGREATLIDSIRNLMETLNLTVEQAMNALKIPHGEQAKYAALL